MIAIIVHHIHQIEQNDSIALWDIKNNCEIQVFDVPRSYELLWDKQGNPYILTKDKIIFAKEIAASTAYAYQMLNNSKNTSKGHRFDNRNHNWLVLQEYIGLPFRYLTFVLKDLLESSGNYSYNSIFDQEPYNYIFNRKTAFLDGNFVKNDTKQLLSVLQNF